MSDPHKLLQDVLDAPDDDAPRLAYADWCAQQADALSQGRAQFIRAQVAVAKPDFGKRPALERTTALGQSTDLRDAHGDAWAGPLKAMVQAFGYHRGFVSWIKVSARDFMTQAPRLFALAPIQHLDLTGVRDVGEELFECEYLRRLKSLSMDACGLYDIHLQLLADSSEVSSLRWLSLADNHLGLPGAEALAASQKLPALRHAEFRGNPVDPCEQLGIDGGEVVSSWMPQEGIDLEARHGFRPWLHREVIEHRFA